MNLAQFKQVSDYQWLIAPHGQMCVPAVIYADRALIQEMDQKVYEQITNVATLPGIVKAAYAMPDAHWGYGFVMINRDIMSGKLVADTFMRMMPGSG